MSVAIAGGTGGLGRALVEAIQARGTYKVADKSQKPGRVHLVVDYSNENLLVSILEGNKVDTVISVVNNITGENAAEISLIRASERSKTTKRLIPSYSRVAHLPEQYETFPLAMAKKSALDTHNSTSLEWTVVYNEYLSDYFGTPKLKSYMDDVAFFIDVANNVAAIPGSGDVPIAFTHTYDAGRFVARLLEHPDWPQETCIVGDKLSFHQIVRFAEQVKAQSQTFRLASVVPRLTNCMDTKFIISHDSVEDLEAARLTESPSHRQIYQFYPKKMLHSFLCLLGLNCQRGLANLTPPRTLNDEFLRLRLSKFWMS